MVINMLTSMILGVLLLIMVVMLIVVVGVKDKAYGENDKFHRDTLQLYTEKTGSQLECLGVLNDELESKLLDKNTELDKYKQLSDKLQAKLDKITVGVCTDGDVELYKYLVSRGVSKSKLELIFGEVRYNNLNQ